MGDSWVLTGAGLVTAAGDTPRSLLAAIEGGAPIAALDPDAGVPVAALVGFDPKTYIQKKGLKDLSRMSQLACAAAAGNAAGLAGVPVEDVGVVLGSAWGSLTTVVSFEREAFIQGPRFVDPILFTETVANVPAGQVAIFFGWSAFNATIAAGGASGLAGVLRGLDFLVEGRGKIAVAGGADELNAPLLRSLHARGKNPPLSGEGACFVTIESETGARARAATPQARIGAWFAQFAGSIEDLIRELLRRAALSPGEVDLVVADERKAVHEVFGGTPRVIEPERVLGECWGASGALAVVVAMESIRAGTARSAVVLDGSDGGHQLGIVLRAVERPDERT